MFGVMTKYRRKFLLKKKEKRNKQKEWQILLWQEKLIVAASISNGGKMHALIPIKEELDLYQQ